MVSKFINVKYLAVLLLGIIFLLLASLDAFSGPINIPQLEKVLTKSY